MSKVAIILPVYNEVKRIDNCLKPLLNYFSNLNSNYLILIVDDGSTDNSINYITNNYKIKNLDLIKLNKNYGKGYAVRKGVLHALAGNYQHIIFGDSDGSWSIKALSNMISDLQNGSDLTIGTRILKDINTPFYRKFISTITRYIYRSIFDLNSIIDTQAGLKGFSFHAAEKIFPNCTQNGWLFDIEILILARRKKIEISQIPISWDHQEGSKINFFTLKKTLNDLPKLLKLVNIYCTFRLIVNFFLVFLVLFYMITFLIKIKLFQFVL